MRSRSFTIKRYTDPRMVSDSLALCINEWNWFMDSKAHWWWVAFAERMWVAYAGLSVYDHSTVYMGPDHALREMRGFGLQRKLIQARHRFARRLGYDRAIAVVAHDNIHSANNYIRSGYTLREPWPGCDPKSYCLYFEREL